MADTSRIRSSVPARPWSSAPRVLAASLFAVFALVAAPGHAEPGPALADEGGALSLRYEFGYLRTLDEEVALIRLHGLRPVGLQLDYVRTWPRARLGVEAGGSMAWIGSRPFSYENPTPNGPERTERSTIPNVRLNVFSDARWSAGKVTLRAGGGWQTEMWFWQWATGDVYATTHHMFTGLAARFGVGAEVGPVDLASGIELPVVGWTARSRYGQHDDPYLRAIQADGFGEIVGMWGDGEWTSLGDVFTVRWVTDARHSVGRRWALTYGALAEVTRVWLYRDATWTTLALRFGASWNHGGGDR